MPYTFHLDLPGGPLEWTSDDVTLDEMCAVETETRIKYDFLDPSQEAEARRAMIVVHLRRTMPDEEARKQAGALTARQVRVVKAEEDDRPTDYKDGIPVAGLKDNEADPRDPKAGGGEPVTS